MKWDTWYIEKNKKRKIMKDRIREIDKRDGKSMERYR